MSTSVGIRANLTKSKNRLLKIIAELDPTIHKIDPAVSNEENISQIDVIRRTIENEIHSLQSTIQKVNENYIVYLNHIHEIKDEDARNAELAIHDPLVEAADSHIAALDDAESALIGLEIKQKDVNFLLRQLGVKKSSSKACSKNSSNSSWGSSRDSSRLSSRTSQRLQKSHSTHRSQKSQFSHPLQKSSCLKKKSPPPKLRKTHISSDLQLVLASSPRTELPKYDGKPENFSSFWSVFGPMADSLEIPPSSKMRYLRTYCTEEAWRPSDGLEFTDSNYDIAKNIFGSLKEENRHKVRLPLKDPDPKIGYLNFYYRDQPKFNSKKLQQTGYENEATGTSKFFIYQYQQISCVKHSGLNYPEFTTKMPIWFNSPAWSTRSFKLPKFKPFFAPEKVNIRLFQSKISNFAIFPNFLPKMARITLVFIYFHFKFRHLGNFGALAMPPYRITPYQSSTRQPHSPINLKMHIRTFFLLNLACHLTTYTPYALSTGQNSRRLNVFL